MPSCSPPPLSPSGGLFLPVPSQGTAELSTSGEEIVSVLMRCPAACRSKAEIPTSGAAGRFTHLIVTYDRRLCHDHGPYRPYLNRFQEAGWCSAGYQQLDPRRACEAVCSCRIFLMHGWCADLRPKDLFYQYLAVHLLSTQRGLLRIVCGL